MIIIIADVLTDLNIQVQKKDLEGLLETAALCSYSRNVPLW